MEDKAEGRTDKDSSSHWFRASLVAGTVPATLHNLVSDSTHQPCKGSSF